MTSFLSGEKTACGAAEGSLPWGARAGGVICPTLYEKSPLEMTYSRLEQSRGRPRTREGRCQRRARGRRQRGGCSRRIAWGSSQDKGKKAKGKCFN